MISLVDLALLTLHVVIALLVFLDNFLLSLRVRTIVVSLICYNTCAEQKSLCCCINAISSVDCGLTMKHYEIEIAIQ